MNGDRNADQSQLTRHTSLWFGNPGKGGVRGQLLRRVRFIRLLHDGQVTVAQTIDPDIFFKPSPNVTLPWDDLVLVKVQHQPDEHQKSVWVHWLVRIDAVGAGDSMLSNGSLCSQFEKTSKAVQQCMRRVDHSPQVERHA